MGEIRFLFDEDVSHKLWGALLREEPGIDILVVGEEGVPPKRTLDPEVLVFAEENGRLLVSHDKTTLPGHLADHYAKGRHTHGVILLKRGYSFARYIEDLVLIWHATTPADWVDRLATIPFGGRAPR